MVVALAAMAAAALVQAMVTDGWEGVRHKVARLFGRGQPDVAIERMTFPMSVGARGVPARPADAGCRA